MSVVKINAIEVPEGSGAELEKRFGARLHAVDQQPGFLGFELLRPVSGETRYFVYTKWETEEAYQAWATGGAAAAAHAGERAKPVSSGASLLEFEVVLGSQPGE
ncbi:antibiotic biosynthesis monooxygenase [Amycolatopsis sp. WQ 127309]|uniref:antibiotic biosynthesis monooxygenase family protein n=1 Tax=Amycolatopsis sp. WQ 127309 TaxID=2932773 RepID=UPI001FF5128B|nr:antibiotic biosynthesis monooxygenase [Amycolatopsis sp. WQ 127309]UOZ08360.1 antibiotic biosynthesis monooxygenase [Amycolatopsis sp. WQ 127309]